MDILTTWLRSYLPRLDASDAELAEALTLRGIAVEGIFAVDAELGGGSRFEMDITTNRVDAMNHYGVAREVAAIYDLPLAPITEAATLAAEQSGDPFPVRIEAEDLCGRFTARVVRGVHVAAAAGVISQRFAALGQKPISGPVDVTNFGWMAMGQPTHVFDLDTLDGGIVVRRAHAGERLKLLDGSEKVLTAEDLVVADEKKALALAGVMGGWDSRVTETTRNILVEAAWFAPTAIRASSRRHGLHTDASHRFERGADFAAAPAANNLVSRLVAEQSGGAVVGPLIDVVVPAWAARTAKRPAVALRVREVTRILGRTLRGDSIAEDKIAQYITALGCELRSVLPGEYEVLLPSWRLDLEREIDLIEEIARVHGYNQFADTLPAFSGAVREAVGTEQEQTIRRVLRGLGFSEAISSTFCAAEEAASFGESAPVALGNPLSTEAGVLRPSLLPGMAGMLAHNLHRDLAAVQLFELGTIFTGSTEEVRERPSLVLGSTGVTAASPLHRAEDALFFELKGALEALLAAFSAELRLTQEELPAWIAPGRGARILLEGRPLGAFGELNTVQLEARKLRQTCVLAELDAGLLLGTPLRRPLMRELSRFQSVERDFSFIFAETVSWQQVESAVRRSQPAELCSVLPLEIFRDAKGKAVAPGHYSLLLRVVFQATDRTLTEDELADWSAAILVSLQSLGGVQRA